MLLAAPIMTDCTGGFGGILYPDRRQEFEYGH